MLASFEAIILDCASDDIEAAMIRMESSSPAAVTATSLASGEGRGQGEIRRRWRGSLLAAAVAITAAAGCGKAEHPAPGPSIYSSRCEGTHAWDIAITGSGLSALEGRRVWLAAVEPGHDPRVVRLETRVKNGRFALSCAKGLSTNSRYPTWAVVIDADGNERCSADDVQTSAQLYGWDFDIQQSIDGRQMSPVSSTHTVVGDHDHFDFCALYFGP